MQRYRAAGLAGPFRGLTATVIRETPSYGVYFAAYEVSAHTLHATRPVGGFVCLWGVAYRPARPRMFQCTQCTQCTRVFH